MDEFKLVKEESFESIARYLNILYSITDMNNPLAFVTCDYKKYMITKVDDEQDLVNNQIEQYYNRTNHLKNFLSSSTPEEIKKKKQQILYINVDNLKMLKYHKPIIQQNNIKKKNEDEEEIN
jgi:hypothetical protein